MLEINNITVCYKERPTVKNFSLELEEGQIVSLVGESGSGKTTVIRSVLGLLPGGGRVTEGDILFEGKSLLQNTPDQWRKIRGTDISMIFQDSGAMLNPIRKIGDGFVEYIRIHEDISKKDAWEKGITMLEKMRLAGMGLAAQNDGGQVTVHAFGVCPGEDLTIQATVMEVQR